jgi:glucosyl-3-phosphoglycerate synthase
MSVRARAWYPRNTFSHSAFPPARLAAERQSTVSVCLPARDEASTIGPILEALLPLRERGVIDQIVVVDNSADDTGAIARQLGAEVHDQAQLMPELGPVLGKGDAMWRALPVLQGEVICFLDADSGHFGAHYPCGLLGPLLCQPEISFVKGLYRRPLRVGQTVLPDGGGRVTELTARPLLNLFYPDLAGVAQPGYGVDIALLLDAYALVGLDGLAQVDLEVRQNAHQPLRDLGPMAHEVLRAVAARLEREGRLRGHLPATFTVAGADGLNTARDDAVERPPLATLRAAA